MAALVWKQVSYRSKFRYQQPQALLLALLLYACAGEKQVGVLDARGVVPVQGNVMVFPHGGTKGSLVHEGSAVVKVGLTNSCKTPAPSRDTANHGPNVPGTVEAALCTISNGPFVLTWFACMHAMLLSLRLSLLAPTGQLASHTVALSSVHTCKAVC